jgi:hypothetical protein
MSCSIHQETPYRENKLNNSWLRYYTLKNQDPGKTITDLLHPLLARVRINRLTIYPQVYRLVSRQTGIRPMNLRVDEKVTRLHPAIRTLDWQGRVVVTALWEVGVCLEWWKSSSTACE